MNEGKEKMKTLKTVSRKILFVLFAAFASMALFGAALLFCGTAKAESVFPAGGKIEIADGTSLKLNEKGGLRFIVRLNEEAKRYIKDNDAEDAVKLEVCVGTVALLKQSDDTIRENALTATVDEDKLYQVSGDENWYANVCVVSVKEANRKLDYTVKAFVVDGGTVVKTSALNDMARGNFYDVTTMALLDESEDYAQPILNLAGYSWLGANEEFPILIDSLDLYNGLVAKINAGLDFSEKYVAIRSSVDVDNGVALNEGKVLPENNYKISRVTFKNGETELGSVLVKNGEQATFAAPEDGTDGDDKIVFEMWVTENGGDIAADLSAITGDVTVYAKYRRVHANAITAFNTADIIYGETPAFTATAKYGEAAITYSKTKDGEYKTWAELENHDAGKYFAKASVVATADYSAAEQIVEFNVNKATGNAVTDFTMADRIHCNDTPAPKANATYGTVTYLYSKTADGDFVAWENAKYDGIGNYTYYVKAAVTETANYDAAESAVKSFRSEHEFENGVCSLGGTAHTQSGISYEIDGDVACIAGYSGNHSTEVYPVAEYEGKPVTYVKTGCAWNPNVTKIVLPASVTDFKGNSFEAASNLEYISMTGVEHITTGNNFINCSKIKTIIVNKAFNLDNQQFKKHGMTADAQGVIYVDGSASESTFSFTAPDLNEFITGKVFYKGDLSKCGQWKFDDNGEIMVSEYAAHEWDANGKCTHGNCGVYNTQGVAYEYDDTLKAYYVGNNSALNRSEITILGKYDDGVHGEAAVTYIAAYAFKDNSSIRRIILPASVTDFKGNSFEAVSNLEYISMTGVEHITTGNNFINCSKIKTIIVNKAFNLDNQQFKKHGMTADAQGVIYVDGSASESTFSFTAPDLNEFITGKVFYKGDATKCLQWNFDENGEIIHGAAEHNYKDGVCGDCGDVQSKTVTYAYDSANDCYYVTGVSSQTETELYIRATYNDGTNGEYAVKYLAAAAFKDNTTIKKVILPASVDSLEGSVFWGCENLEYVSMTGITNLEYASPYGGDGRNNNFRNCFKLSVVITSNALSSNVGQFGCGATDTSNKKILDFYVYGESGAPLLDYETADANNLCSGNVYYYSETEKSGCWRYVDGVATLWA